MLHVEDTEKEKASGSSEVVLVFKYDKKHKIRLLFHSSITPFGWKRFFVLLVLLPRTHCFNMWRSPKFDRPAVPSYSCYAVIEHFLFGGEGFYAKRSDFEINKSFLSMCTLSADEW